MKASALLQPAGSDGAVINPFRLLVVTLIVSAAMLVALIWSVIGGYREVTLVHPRDLRMVELDGRIRLLAPHHCEPDRRTVTRISFPWHAS